MSTNEAHTDIDPTGAMLRATRESQGQPVDAEPRKDAALEVLKPCPFCDGEAELISMTDHRHYVRCMQCDQQFEQGTSSNAIAAWNRRAAYEAHRVGEAVVKAITMQDVRLAVGEGPLKPIDVLNGANAELRRRSALAVPVPAQGEAVADIASERRRQMEVEGWTAEHDDQHDLGQMAGDAASYAVGSPDWYWPWDRKWWKPTNRRRNLIKAGALIVAEIERLDRAALPTDTTGGSTNAGEAK